jgi:hypothetical protein
LFISSARMRELADVLEHARVGESFGHLCRLSL